MGCRASREKRKHQKAQLKTNQESGKPLVSAKTQSSAENDRKEEATNFPPKPKELQVHHAVVILFSLIIFYKLTFLGKE